MRIHEVGTAQKSLEIFLIELKIVYLLIPKNSLIKIFLKSDQKIIKAAEIKVETLAKKLMTNARQGRH